MNAIEKSDSRFSLSLLSTLPVLLTLTLSPLAGCGSKSNADHPSFGLETPRPQASVTPAAINADGWTQVNIQANYAKTVVDSFAHWTTSRNACGKDADGAMELDLWNRFVAAVNHAVASTPLAEPRCQPNEPDSKMDGNAEVVMTQGKRTLVEIRDTGEICTTVQNEAHAKELISAINAIVLMADKEDCPFGWGRS